MSFYSIEHNKLKLAPSKCNKVHIGKKKDKGYDLKVHNESDKTISDRILRTYSYLSEIWAFEVTLLQNFFKSNDWLKNTAIQSDRSQMGKFVLVV